MSSHQYCSGVNIVLACGQGTGGDNDYHSYID
jgi:hypothetical protein